MTSGDSTARDSHFDALCDTMAKLVAYLRVPGAAVGVVSDGERNAAGFGVTNVIHPLAVDGDTLFQIGSTTKTITATAVVRLMEMGIIDLGAPLRTYLPRLRLHDEETAARVTMRHLLTHSGGWGGDPSALPWWEGDYGDWGHDALAKFVDRISTIPQLTPLGAVWSYNGLGFCLAGRVIEVVTGMSYEAAVTELILEPLGMEHSCFWPGDAITHRVAVGHRVTEKAIHVAKPWSLPRVVHPVGGMVSTVNDLLSYADFHLGSTPVTDGQRPVLARKSRELMRSPLAPGPQVDSIGLAWFVKADANFTIVSHGGSTNGQMSSFMLVPERGFAMTILTNGDTGHELRRVMNKWVLQRYLGIDRPDPSTVKLPKKELLKYAGRYQGQFQWIEISASLGGVLLRFPGTANAKGIEVRAEFFDADRLVVLDNPLRGSQGQFLRDADGRLAWFRFGSRVHVLNSQEENSGRNLMSQSVGVQLD